ncbi:hypothetical protein PMAA_064790 [Talaromyces marneffei ATCC 18224]|uniref:Beta-glucuronidase C-terminal domain-containing protein n=2 Tax=Talaromyces marneffei TaxID=37727 RepID=B6QB27_TALMQ|nr:hypothetical protein PMAA_064790 [Talaromyces marneffei ATCC 18224]
MSCQGAFNISHAMASAVWAVHDAATLHGTPIYHNDTEARVKPIYYSNMFNATVSAGGDEQSEGLVNETTFGAYAVYNEGKLASIVAVNLNMWNSTMDDADHPYTTLSLPRAWNDARVSRLTNSGVYTAENITFAGQYIDGKGHIVGKESFDKVIDGMVYVGSGEAVFLISKQLVN